jgi:hypothetical protein
VTANTAPTAKLSVGLQRRAVHSLHSCLGQACPNDLSFSQASHYLFLIASMSPHSLSRNSLLQPRTYEVPTTPNPEQTYWTMVQQSGQSGPYNEFQLATDDATGRDGRHNDNTVSRPTGQYPNFPSMQHLLPSAIGGTSEHVDPPSRSSGPFMDDRMNRPRTTNTNEYDDRTHFSQPDHYPSFAPQVDPRQPSHIFSSGEPWSSHNLVSDRSFSTMKPTAIDDRRRLGDSDAYSSEQTGSQIFSNASSDWDRSTTDSSVEPLTNDMSDSIATIRASDQIASSQEMLHTDMFEHHPSSVRTASSMSRSLHGGYDRTLQDIEPPTRSQNSRTGSGTRPM